MAEREDYAAARGGTRRVSGLEIVAREILEHMGNFGLLKELVHFHSNFKDGFKRM